MLRTLAYFPGTTFCPFAAPLAAATLRTFAPFGLLAAPGCAFLTGAMLGHDELERL
jgi:hypothetical protein